MNNKIFIATKTKNEALLDDLRIQLEGYHFFEHYGDQKLVQKYNRVGFATVVPDKEKGKFMCFMRMLRCSYVYMPCGWHNDDCSRKAFAWAEFFGKKVIFEEDGRCR